MTTKRQLTLHFDADVAAAIEAEASKRGFNLSRAANDALRRALIDEAGKALADTVKARLDRLDNRDAARARELALIKEIVLLFVRFWLNIRARCPTPTLTPAPMPKCGFRASYRCWRSKWGDQSPSRAIPIGQSPLWGAS